MSRERFSAFPIRTSIIPCYMQIDQKILLAHILNESYIEIDIGWWDKYFFTDNKAFKAQSHHPELPLQHFTGTMYTDGVGVTILKERTKKNSRKGCKNLNEEDKRLREEEKQKKEKEKKKLLAEKRKRDREEGIYQKKKKKENNEFDFLRDCTSEQLKETEGKCVLIDPNRRDLLYMMHENSTKDKPNIYRYTWNQQMKETGARKRNKFYRKVRDNSSQINYAINELSQTSHKSINLEVFTRYVEVKSAHLTILETHYEQLIFRKLKWQGYKLQQQSEVRLVENVRKRFGHDAVLIIGDHSNPHMRFQCPVRGKAFIRLFKKYSFRVLILDEHKTSKICPDCDSEVERFMYQRDPRSSKTANELKLCHGLLRCNSERCQIGTWKRYWNRDTLAVLNFRRILKTLREGKERPESLRRHIRLS